jgi:hypothetical protein
MHSGESQDRLKGNTTAITPAPSITASAAGGRISPRSTKELVIERGGGVRPHHLGTTQTRTHSGEAVAGAGRADAAQVATKNAQHPSAHQVGAPDQQRNSRQKIQQLFQRERSR